MKRDPRIERALSALKRNGFEAEFVLNRDEARDRVLEIIPASASVGIPGSKSVRQAGIAKALKARGHKVFDHWAKGLSPNDVLECRKRQLSCDVLVTSTNALTESGKLVNWDGIGNRVAAMIFGPGQVIVMAGINKLVKDLSDAEERIKNIAAPRRARELNLSTPCVESGKCEDCDHDMRICRITTILNRCPGHTRFMVMLVGEELGN